MALPAVHPVAPVAGVRLEQALQQTPAQRLHGRADGELDAPQALRPDGGVQTGRGERGQALYLRGELRAERREEPLFSAPVSVGGAPSASGDTGRASQMASFTPTISFTTALKRL